MIEGRGMFAARHKAQSEMLAFNPPHPIPKHSPTVSIAESVTLRRIASTISTNSFMVIPPGPTVGLVVEVMIVDTGGSSSDSSSDFSSELDSELEVSELEVSELEDLELELEDSELEVSELEE